MTLTQGRVAASDATATARVKAATTDSAAATPARRGSVAARASAARSASRRLGRCASAPTTSTASAAPSAISGWNIATRLPTAMATTVSAKVGQAARRPSTTEAR